MKLIELIRSVYATSAASCMSEEALRSDLSLKTTVSLLLSLASAALTVMNYANGYWFMMATTAILTLGFLLCTLLSRKYKKRTAVNIIMAALCGFIFTVYAVTGGNEGFAILWILLVPPIGMSLVGLRTGTALSAYFQLFLIVLFYTPLRSHVQAYYTAMFQSRFPILYLTIFVSSVVLAAQKEYYFRKTEKMAYMDALTGLYNRRHYDLVKKRIEESGGFDGLALLSIDINRLKYTNDTLGHKAGDELIIGAAECVMQAFPDAEAVCRTGGDEFMVLCYTDADSVSDRLRGLTERSKTWHGTYITSISLSAGAAFAAEHPGSSVEELEKLADKAMYAAKSRFYVESGLDRRR